MFVGLGRHPSSDFVSSHPAFYSTLCQSGYTFADRQYFSEFKQTTIGHDVWIGAKVIVLDGVNIGNGAIIAAGSIVTRNVPPFAVVAGTPAKILRYRFTSDQIKFIQHTEWWNKDIYWLRRHFKIFHNIGLFCSTYHFVDHDEATY